MDYEEWQTFARGVAKVGGGFVGTPARTTATMYTTSTAATAHVHLGTLAVLRCSPMGAGLRTGM